MKDITVQEFIDTYNRKESDQERQDYLKSLVKVEYMPYTTKITLTEKIIENSYWKDTEKKNFIEVNSPIRHILSIYTMINNYTYIHIDNKRMAEDYDLLEKNRLVEKIITAIGEDVKSFSVIEEMTAQDFMTNHYGTKAFLQEQSVRLQDVIKEVGTSLAPVFSDALKDLSKDDIIKFVKAISK